MNNNSKIAKQFSSRGIMKIYPFIGLAIVIIGFTIFSKGSILSLKNITKIFEQSFSLLLVSTAACFLLAQNCLDMSVGANVGMAATVAAYVSKTSVPLALVAAVVTGLAIGGINGFLHGVLKINAMIATLAVQFILRGLLLILCNSGTVGIAVGMYALDNLLLKIILCVVFVAVCFLIFQYHSFGKKCRAAGAGDTSASQSGVNLRKLKVIAYLFVGATAGIAGFFTVIRSGAAIYNTGSMLEFNVLIALILGGMPINGGAESKIRSAVIGVMILGFLNNGMIMLGLDTYPQLIVKGTVFLVVLAMTFSTRNKNRNENKKSRSTC